MNAMPHAAPHVRDTMTPPIDRIAQLAREAAQRGQDVISLGQATCNLPPPLSLDRLRDALDPAILSGYTPDAGFGALRAAVADDLRARHGVAVDPEREVLITAGANHAFHSALHTILSPGDEVVLFTPFYFNHEMAVRLLGGRAVECPCGPDMQPDLDRLDACMNARTRVVVLVSPSNPSGRVVPKDLFRTILHLTAARGVWLIFDETYEGIVYPAAEAYSAAAALPDADNLVVISSFSKRLGLAGCRVGTLLARAGLIEQMMKIQDTTVICAAGLSQRAAMLGLPRMGAHLAEVVRAMQPRRALMAQRLGECRGLRAAAPDGAFFFFADASASGLTSWDFVERLIREEGVVTVPGASCGQGWERHVRLAFGGVDEARLAEALDRVQKFWARCVT